MSLSRDLPTGPDHCRRISIRSSAHHIAMMDTEEKINSLIAAYSAETVLFTGLPLLKFAFADAFFASRFAFMILPLCVFPVIAFSVGIAAGLRSGYLFGAALITPAAFLPAFFIFGFGSVGLPLIKLLLIYFAACLLGLLIAFPAYCQRKLLI